MQWCNSDTNNIQLYDRSTTIIVNLPACNVWNPCVLEGLPPALLLAIRVTV